MRRRARGCHASAEHYIKDEAVNAPIPRRTSAPTTRRAQALAEDPLSAALRTLSKPLLMDLLETSLSGARLEAAASVSDMLVRRRAFGAGTNAPLEPQAKAGGQIEGREQKRERRALMCEGNSQKKGTSRWPC